MSNKDMYSRLIDRYRSKGIAIDSNLLLLLFVGLFDKERIGKFKRTNEFVVEDFISLTKIVREFRLIITTPNILTEVDNLTKHLTGDPKLAFIRVFKVFILKSSERYIESSKIILLKQFIEVGITDTTLYKLACSGTLIITKDGAFARLLERENLPVINFNHLRPYGW